MKNGSKVSVRDVIYSIDTVGNIAKEISSSGTKDNTLSSNTLSYLSGQVNTFMKD